MPATANPKGHYRFLPAISPFSSGVVADPGHEIVHVALREWLPWRKGFDRVDAFLADDKRPRHALCAMELRIPAPLPFEGFKGFNREYRKVLLDWDLMVDGVNPIARTNIAPEVKPPGEPVLHAFSYVRPAEGAPPTFIVAGAGDLRDQAVLSEESIVRPAETSLEAITEKASVVLDEMEARLEGLGRTWSEVSTIDVYTVHPFRPETILDRAGAAAARGLAWTFGRPPIAGLDFEMDLRGVRSETIL